MATATKYLLPCTCGQSVVIDVGQAGQQVTCTCGRTQEAPTMRGVRALPIAEEASAADAKVRESRPAWSSLQGALFGAGFLLAFIALCLAGYNGLVYSQIHVHEPPPSAIEAADNRFNALRPHEMFDVYIAARDKGIGPQLTPDYVHAKRAKEHYRNLMLYSLGGAVAGLALAASAFLVAPRKAPSPEKVTAS